MITLATLDELRQEWVKTHDAMSDLTRNMRAQIVAAQEQVAELEGPYREQLALFEEQMRPLVTPETPPVGYGVKIAHRRAYDKVSCDGKGLDGYMVADPKLANFRKVTTVKASTTFSRVEDE